MKKMRNLLLFAGTVIILLTATAAQAMYVVMCSDIGGDDAGSAMCALGGGFFTGGKGGMMGGGGGQMGIVFDDNGFVIGACIDWGNGACKMITGEEGEAMNEPDQTECCGCVRSCPPKCEKGISKERCEDLKQRCRSLGC